jgi:hypothetical protein
MYTMLYHSIDVWYVTADCIITVYWRAFVWIKFIYLLQRPQGPGRMIKWLYDNAPAHRSALVQAYL